MNNIVTDPGQGKVEEDFLGFVPPLVATSVALERGHTSHGTHQPPLPPSSGLLRETVASRARERDKIGHHPKPQRTPQISTSSSVPIPDGDPAASSPKNATASEEVELSAPETEPKQADDDLSTRAPTIGTTLQEMVQQRFSSAKTAMEWNAVESSILSVVEEKHIVTEVPAEEEQLIRRNISLRRQANMHVNDAETLKKRAELKQSSRLGMVIKMFWDRLVKDPFDEEALPKESYMGLCEKLFYILVPHGTAEDCQARIEADWAFDSKGKQFMSYQMFFDAMFALTDVWVERVDEEEYVKFLHNRMLDVTADTLPDDDGDGAGPKSARRKKKKASTSASGSTPTALTPRKSPRKQTETEKNAGATKVSISGGGGGETDRSKTVDGGKAGAKIRAAQQQSATQNQISGLLNVAITPEDGIIDEDDDTQGKHAYPPPSANLTSPSRTEDMKVATPRIAIESESPKMHLHLSGGGPVSPKPLSSLLTRTSPGVSPRKSPREDANSSNAGAGYSSAQKSTYSEDGSGKNEATSSVVPHHPMRLPPLAGAGGSGASGLTPRSGGTGGEPGGSDKTTAVGSEHDQTSGNNKGDGGQTLTDSQTLGRSPKLLKPSFNRDVIPDVLDTLSPRERAAVLKTLDHSESKPLGHAKHVLKPSNSAAAGLGTGGGPNQTVASMTINADLFHGKDSPAPSTRLTPLARGGKAMRSRSATVSNPPTVLLAASTTSQSSTSSSSDAISSSSVATPTAALSRVSPLRDHSLDSPYSTQLRSLTPRPTARGNGIISSLSISPPLPTTVAPTGLWPNTSRFPTSFDYHHSPPSLSHTPRQGGPTTTAVGPNFAAHHRRLKPQHPEPGDPEQEIIESDIRIARYRWQQLSNRQIYLAECARLDVQPVQQFASVLSEVPGEFDLLDVQLSWMDVVTILPFVDLIRMNPKIGSVDLRANYLSAASIALLGRMLWDHPTVSQVDLSGNPPLVKTDVDFTASYLLRLAQKNSNMANMRVNSLRLPADIRQQIRVELDWNRYKDAISLEEYKDRKAIFAAIDRDGSQSIELSELHEYLMSHGVDALPTRRSNNPATTGCTAGPVTPRHGGATATPRPATPSSSGRVAGAGASSAAPDKGLVQSLSRDVIRRHDANGDARLSFAEFLQVFYPHIPSLLMPRFVQKYDPLVVGAPTTGLNSSLTSTLLA